MKHVTMMLGFTALLSMFGCSSSSTADLAADGGGTGSDGATSSDGGKGDAGGDATMMVSADAKKACADAADAVCAKFESCSSFGLIVAYGDAATCKTRFALGCVAALGAPSTSGTAATTEACAQAFPSVSCADFLTANLTGACAPIAGGLANGAPCGDDGQCTSTFCARTATSQCGTCSPLSTASGACTNQSCSRGLSCPKGGASCVVPKAGAVDDACTVQEDCDLAHAVGCNTGTMKCLALKSTTAGMTCGADSITPTNFTVCAAAGSCSSVLGGTCSVAAADGATCGTADSAPHCMAPSRCVSGKCALPDATACH